MPRGSHKEDQLTRGSVWRFTTCRQNVELPDVAPHIGGSHLRLTLQIVGLTIAVAYRFSSFATEKGKPNDAFSTSLERSPKLRQVIKIQNPLNGELSHGVVTQAVHERVLVGRRAAAGTRYLDGGGCTRVGSEPRACCSAGERSSAAARAMRFRATANSAGRTASLRNWNARSVSKRWRSLF
jgi:hypothetical protein